MTIGAVGGSQTAAPGKIGGNQNDPVAKGLRDRLQQAQKELQELSAKKDMSPEQKQKKRQELQQEVSDLNMQLRQHEMEEKIKEREKKRQTEDNPLGLPENQDNALKKSGPGVEIGISAAGMEALISADGTRKTADVQGSVAHRMEGRAAVLESEIQMDGARGGDTSAKQQQLADVNSKAQAAQAAQMSTLSEAGEKLEEAAAGGAGIAEEEKKDQAEVDSKDDAQNDAENGNGEENGNGGKQTDGYAPVDVRCVDVRV